jgi:hypothetical protein
MGERVTVAFGVGSGVVVGAWVVTVAGVVAGVAVI